MEKFYIWFGPLTLLYKEKQYLLSEARKNQAYDAGQREVSQLMRGALFALLKNFVSFDSGKVILTKSSMGKPYFLEFQKKLNLQFNFSHSKTHFAFVFAEAEVGIDVESARSIARPERLAERILSPQELEAFQNENIPLLQFWCRKEAVLKALGAGIRASLNSVNVLKSPIDLSEPLIFPTEHKRTYYWKDIYLDESIYSCIASSEEMTNVEAYRVEGFEEFSYKSILPLSF